MSQITFNLIVGTVLRGAIMALAGYLAAHGLLPQGSIEEWVGAVVLVLLGLGWGLYQKAAQQTQLHAAMALPAGATMEQVTNKVASDKAKAAIGIVVLAVVLSPLLVGCGAARQTPRHIAVMGETSFKEAVIQFGVAERALYESKVVPGLTLEKHKAINAKLVAIDDAGIRVVQVLLAWPEGAPTPAELRTLVTNIKWLVDEVSAVLPDSAEKSELLGYLSTAQGWLLSVITPAADAHPDAVALVTQLEAIHAH